MGVKAEAMDEGAAECLKWLGAFGDSAVEAGSSPVDAFCTLLQSKLDYAPGERDMALMYHEFECEFEDGRPNETRTSTFLEYGSTDGKTIMAKTVGLTVA